MDSTPIFEVADHRDFEVVELALSLHNRIEVKHSLRGMLVGAIPGVDDGGLGHCCGIFRSAFLIMTHYYQVDIV